MKGKVIKPGVVEAINGRQYHFHPADAAPIGATVEFDPQGQNAHLRNIQRPRLNHGGGKPVPSKENIMTLEDIIDRLPYDFVPIEPDLSLKSTIPHHQGQSGRLSGEILLELKTLTPLLVGNYRYLGKEMRPRPNCIAAEQAVLEPLMDDQKRVLIPGSSLTGMLRASMSALLSAPMERVTERYYSYRIGQKIHPAIMLDDQHCLVLKWNAPVIFVRSQAYDALNRPPAGQLLTDSYPVSIQQDERLPFKKRLIASGNTRLNHYIYDYQGGIDGQGLLARVFRNNAFVYHQVLVKKQDVDAGQEMRIPDLVYKHYQRTQKELADQAYGHISSRHPKRPNKPNDIIELSKAIRRQKELRPNQLIYVEIRQGRIVSMGHHYHYRQAYRDTVLMLNGQQKRPEITPQYEWDEQGHPVKTDAIRALFGYVDADQSSPFQYDDDKRLAGRLAFNMAVEQVSSPDPNRFLDRGRGLQLKILGTPRPSAVECYIDQSNRPKGRLNTYGDLPDEPGGDLRGRKFYPHQAELAQKIVRGQLNHFRLTGHNEGNQELSTFARFISQSGTVFRCKLRFSQLEDWELGAVLAALDPESFLDYLPKNIDFQVPNGRDPLFAHKLGYAQPLGFGSVHIRIQALRLQQPHSTDFWQEVASQNYLQAFKKELDSMLQRKEGRHLIKKWLQIHQYRGTGLRNYPHINHQIFKWHSKQRRAHQDALKNLRS